MKVKFLLTSIENFIPTIQPNEYDLVLGLSIFRELYKAHKFSEVQDMMAELAKKIPVCIFEPELEKEFPEDDLPKYYIGVFKDFRIRKVLSRNAGENPEIERPLVFASNDYIFFDELGLLKIDDAHSHNMMGSENDDKLFIFCGDKFIKFSKIFEGLSEGNGSYERVTQGVKFLSEFGGSHGFPKLYASEIYKDEYLGQSFIVRDKLEGETLEKIIASGEDFDHWDVIKQVLSQLVFLEENGLYHDDVHQCNVLYKDGKAFLIDYESIGEQKSTAIHRFNLLQVFFSFMCCLLENVSQNVNPKLLLHLKKHVDIKKYHQISKIKSGEKFFARLYEILFESDDDEKNIEDYTAAEEEILLLEDNISFSGGYIHRRVEEHQRYLAMSVDPWIKAADKLIYDQCNKMEDVENFLNTQAMPWLQVADKVIQEQQKRIEALEKIVAELKEKI